MAERTAYFRNNEQSLGAIRYSINEKVGDIATQVGQTPAAWNGGIYRMIRSLSETVIVPIAGLVSCICNDA